MSPETNSEKITEWMVGKQREEFRRESEKRRLDEYRKLDDQEARLRGEIGRQEGLLGEAGSELEEAEAEFQAARARLEAARRSHELIHFQFADLRSQLEAISSKRQRLSRPALTEFIAEAWKRFDEIRSKTASYERARVQAVTGKQTFFFLSNARAIDEALKIVRGVVDQAEKLKLEALTDKELETAINKLRAELPDPVATAQREEQINFAPVLISDVPPVRYA